MKISQVCVLAVFASTCLTFAAADAAEPVPPGLVALPAHAPEPTDNPSTPAKVALGRQLFFDPRLSVSGTISCNSCHNVMGSGTDNLSVSVGVGGKLGGRSAPTVYNAAFMSVQFWDGRAPSLEEQAKGPMTNPVEMGMTSHELVMKRILQLPGYKKAFGAAFGKETPTIDHAVKAIAAYERTLTTPGSAFDRYVKGDASALGAPAIRGMKLVQSVGCIACHNGPNFAGPEMPLGTGFYQKFPTFSGTEYEKIYHLSDDPGRFMATKKAEDSHLWRVPTWRNVALTAPYFHNGSVKTLDEAVRVMAKTQLNKTLTETEVKDIVSFLDSLTGEFPQQAMPRLPEALNASGIAE
ncbi:MAG: cytochrome-c peroxidase [Bdellovibrionota bacterium]